MQSLLLKTLQGGINLNKQKSSSWRSQAFLRLCSSSQEWHTLDNKQGCSPQSRSPIPEEKTCHPWQTTLDVPSESTEDTKVHLGLLLLAKCAVLNVGRLCHAGFKV